MAEQHGSSNTAIVAIIVLVVIIILAFFLWEPATPVNDSGTTEVIETEVQGMPDVNQVAPDSVNIDLNGGNGANQ